MAATTSAAAATAARTTAAAGAAADTATSGVATTVAASDAAVDGGLHRHHRASRHQRRGNETHIAHEQTHFEDAGVGPVGEGHARVAPDADDVADVPNVDTSRRPRVHDTKHGELTSTSSTAFLSLAACFFSSAAFPSPGCRRLVADMAKCRMPNAGNAVGKKILQLPQSPPSLSNGR